MMGKGGYHPLVKKNHSNDQLQTIVVRNIPNRRDQKMTISNQPSAGPKCLTEFLFDYKNFKATIQV